MKLKVELFLVLILVLYVVNKFLFYRILLVLRC